MSISGNELCVKLQHTHYGVKRTLDLSGRELLPYKSEANDDCPEQWKGKASMWISPNFFQNYFEAKVLFHEMNPINKDFQIKIKPMMQANGELVHPYDMDSNLVRYIAINPSDSTTYKMLNILNHEVTHMNGPHKISELILTEADIPRKLILNEIGFRIYSKWSMELNQSEIEEYQDYQSKDKGYGDLSKKVQFLVKSVVGEKNFSEYEDGSLFFQFPNVSNEGVIEFATNAQLKTNANSHALNEFYTEAKNIMELYLFLDSKNLNPENELEGMPRGYSLMMENFEEKIVLPLFKNDKNLFKRFYEAMESTYNNSDLAILRDFINKNTKSQNEKLITKRDLRKIASGAVLVNFLLSDKQIINKIAKHMLGD